MNSNEIKISEVDMSKVDMRFAVSVEAVEETEKMSTVAMMYTTKNMEQYINLPLDMDC